MRRLFARKRIAELQPDESDASLRRALGATDLILLAIGAVIGAGIFSSIGTAAAGEISELGRGADAVRAHLDTVKIRLRTGETK